MYGHLVLIILSNELFNSWWQEGIESQAIDRCNRYVSIYNCSNSMLTAICFVCSIGQTKPVRVYQMIAEDTVEAKVCHKILLR